MQTIRAYGDKYAASEFSDVEKKEAGFLIPFIFILTILGVIYNIIVNMLERYDLVSNIFRCGINLLKIFSINLIKYYLNFSYDFGKLNIPSAYSFAHLNILMCSFFPCIMIIYNIGLLAYQIKVKNVFWAVYLVQEITYQVMFFAVLWLVFRKRKYICILKNYRLSVKITLMILSIEQILYQTQYYSKVKYILFNFTILPEVIFLFSNYMCQMLIWDTLVNKVMFES